MRNNKEKGQSLMEVIFALALIGLVAVAIVGLATVSIRNNISSRNSTQAKRYAQEALDWLRKKRDVGPWSLFYSYSNNTYCLDSLNADYGDSWTLGTQGDCGEEDYIAGTQLIRELVLTSVDSDKVNAEVTVYWTDAKGVHISQLTTELVEW